MKIVLKCFWRKNRYLIAFLIIWDFFTKFWYLSIPNYFFRVRYQLHKKIQSKNFKIKNKRFVTYILILNKSDKKKKNFLKIVWKLCNSIQFHIKIVWNCIELRHSIQSIQFIQFLYEIVWKLRNSIQFHIKIVWIVWNCMDCIYSCQVNSPGFWLLFTWYCTLLSRWRQEIVY